MSRPDHVALQADGLRCRRCDAFEPVPRDAATAVLVAKTRAFTDVHGSCPISFVVDPRTGGSR